MQTACRFTEAGVGFPNNGVLSRCLKVIQPRFTRNTTSIKGMGDNQLVKRVKADNSTTTSHSAIDHTRSKYRRKFLFEYLHAAVSYFTGLVQTQVWRSHTYGHIV